ncbi:DUF559 domain-containing protein [Rhodococcus qingshengii]|uniref:DUF559 domain-containing protein n=1 Tax=Rhodococcus qingshengii TaxID=334542 RepID=UPI0036F2C784
MSRSRAEYPSATRWRLAAAGFDIDHNHPPIQVAGRRPVRADIAIPKLRLVIEYDGAHYHRTGQQADLKQTQALTDAGWSVIRVRELPLESLGGWKCLSRLVVR